MLTLYYKRNIFKICEIFGSISVHPSNQKYDISIHQELLFSPLDNKKSGKFSFHLLIPNYIIDLKQTEQEIYSAIHKNTRYKINRAMKRDSLHYYELTNPTNEELEKFQLFFNPFAKEKGIRVCDMNKLKALRDQNALIISYITDHNGQVLCYHVYHIDDLQSYLIYSASQRFTHINSSTSNLIGRANRLLHWKDIQSFKSKGCEWYNFGGKVLGNHDKRGKNVNTFKLEFGPTVAYDVRTFKANGLMGKIGLFYLFFKWRRSPEYRFSKLVKHKTSASMLY
ncbi:peptidoglycan bridge formation glycyltransferase FemA/FemB family protein [Heyndrickxia camelliae]|uniref:BioF2-like acetyltransferase domain-containing protein n=1 Tax=Heyndrickxia camelliae TaxID=1707093 RepID=A0A2N3LLQ7_9BACI|nr:peptidoglycan bridge formation glycyltransferase FemA/FemB family protein [Heyndrickxia camelliae]PKR85558.1 hypothetical protein CWO92_07545 [Heyndrickxia camelliae]